MNFLVTLSMVTVDEQNFLNVVINFFFKFSIVRVLFKKSLPTPRIVFRDCIHEAVPGPSVLIHWSIVFPVSLLFLYYLNYHSCIIGLYI